MRSDEPLDFLVSVSHQIVEDSCLVFLAVMLPLHLVFYILLEISGYRIRFMMSGYWFYYVMLGFLGIYVSVFLSMRSHRWLLFSCVFFARPVFQSLSC